MTEKEKLDNCKKERLLIKNFLKFANSQGFFLKDDKTKFIGTIGYKNMINSLILSYFNIDSYQLDREKGREP